MNILPPPPQSLIKTNNMETTKEPITTNETETVKHVVTAKQCAQCHQVLPLNHFSPDGRTRDGVMRYCKKCFASRVLPTDSRTAEMVRNSPLAAFTPRELIAELRLRGYNGELKYTQYIKV